MDGDLTRKVLEASKVMLDREILIRTDADLTPAGKRRWGIVSHRLNGKKSGKQIRWYVGRKAYRTLPLSPDNVALSEAWENAQG